METAHKFKELAESVRDFATANGSYDIRQMTVGSYLEMLHLYDPARRNATWDVSVVNARFQRATMPIKGNAIKQRMLRDVMRGGTLPPTVLYARDNLSPQVVDGLQRTHVLTESLKGLLALEHAEEPEPYVKKELEAMGRLNQSPRTVDEFLKRPVAVQMWYGLSPDELVRLFIVLNAGQQKVSPRHLLEVMEPELRDMFQEWDLKLLTEREQAQVTRRRGRKRSDAEESSVIPGITHFRYDYLLDGLVAYVSRDAQVKTTEILKSADSPNLALQERITEVGSEFCRSDFIWVCRDLNKVIQDRYANDPKWKLAIQNSDNFFIPLMAAIGDARFNEKARTALEDRKQKLIEIVRTNPHPDPLSLSGDRSECLGKILDEIKSNIGRRRRAVVYIAWRGYFLRGAEDETYPLNWQLASMF